MRGEKLLIATSHAFFSTRKLFIHFHIVHTFSLTLTEGEKYGILINNAVSADKVVREKYDQLQQPINLLCQSESDLQAAIPSANPTAAVAGSEVCEEIVFSFICSIWLQ